MEKSFSLKDNPFVLKRKSELSQESQMINNFATKSKQSKHCETFVNSLSSDKDNLSDTIRKIMSNSKSSRKQERNNIDTLRSYMTKKNLSSLIEDDIMIKKINLNKNKLKFDQELKVLYDRKYELKPIASEPVFHDYVGFKFRKCYQDVIQKDGKNCYKPCDIQNDSTWNDTTIENVSNSQKETTVDPDETSMNLETVDTKRYICSIPELSQEWLDLHQKHLIESLQAYQYLNDLKMPDAPSILCEEDTFINEGKKLLVFDMDETLIHCVTDIDQCNDYDVKIPCRYSKNLEYKHVNIRPYVIEVLLELSDLFTIIVFTASTQDYADPILNFLDKDFNLIKKRFYRHHCYKTEDQVTMKNLRIFEQCGFDLKDIILVDNATHCFGFQVDNGIPIIPFINNKEDKEFIHLLHFLKKIVDVEDVRPILSQTYNLKHLRQPQILQKIEGVVEYEVEDIDDDFFCENNERKSQTVRPTLNEQISEDIAEEIQEGFQLHSAIKYIPVIRPSHLNIDSLNNRTSNIFKTDKKISSEICYDFSNKADDKLRENQNLMHSIFEEAALLNEHPRTMQFSQDSFDSCEIIVTEICEDFEEI